VTSWQGSIAVVTAVAPLEAAGEGLAAAGDGEVMAAALGLAGAEAGAAAEAAGGDVGLAVAEPPTDEVQAASASTHEARPAMVRTRDMVNLPGGWGAPYWFGRTVNVYGPVAVPVV
jgi:hypothetical protein